MINDMGIQVYDEAPDETLLMSEAAPSAAADDVDEEAAEAAASTLDSEFGRTRTRCACTCARWARSSSSPAR
jgi:RNA polymerase primary sigma factor